MSRLYGKSEFCLAARPSIPSSLLEVVGESGHVTCAVFHAGFNMRDTDLASVESLRKAVMFDLRAADLPRPPEVERTGRGRGRGPYGGPRQGP